MTQRTPKYIFITGGVVSSLGKGLAAASIGCLLEGHGYDVREVSGDEPARVHEAFADTLFACHDRIREIQARKASSRPRWPLIVLRTPKGWTGPRMVDGERVVPLNVGLVSSLADEIRPDCRAVVIKAGLGLRVGKLLGLGVADVDFMRPPCPSPVRCYPGVAADRQFGGLGVCRC